MLASAITGGIICKDHERPITGVTSASPMGLSTVELVMAVEEEFAIQIPNSDAGKMERVGDMHAFVVKTLRQREAAVVNADQVWARLREIIVEQLGVRPEEVTPTAHFIRDLKAD